jgi:hypothetical protein
MEEYKLEFDNLVLEELSKEDTTWTKYLPDTHFLRLKQFYRPNQYPVKIIEPELTQPYALIYKDTFTDTYYNIKYYNNAERLVPNGLLTQGNDKSTNIQIKKLKGGKKSRRNKKNKKRTNKRGKKNAVN